MSYDHECIECEQYSPDLKQCPICEEDICPACWGKHDAAHQFGPRIVAAIENGDDKALVEWIRTVNSTVLAITPFTRNPITTEA